MPTNIAYESAGDVGANANDNDQNCTSSSTPPSSGINTITNRSQPDEGTLLAVGAADTYFSDEKIHIPDIDTVSLPDSGLHAYACIHINYLAVVLLILRVVYIQISRRRSLCKYKTYIYVSSAMQ